MKIRNASGQHITGGEVRATNLEALADQLNGDAQLARDDLMRSDPTAYLKQSAKYAARQATTNATPVDMTF